MDTTAIAKELIHYQKSVINNAFEIVGLFQEQTERIAEVWIKKNADLTAENRKSIQQWAQLFSKGSQHYKKMMDDHLNKFESLLATSTPTRAVKPMKSSPAKANEEENKKHTATKKQPS